MADELHHLMAATAKGDQVAFRQLAHALNPVLYSTGLGIFRARTPQLEDAAQEALIKLWQAAPNWGGTGSVEAFARTVMKNCALDVIRREKRHIAVNDSETALAMEATPQAPEGTAHDINAGLRQLTPQQRKVATLYYVAGEKQSDIAARMGKSEKAVERMLAYARQKLRTFAGEE